MSDLTAELNLALAVESDDTDDYLTTNAGLRGSLVTIDGLFNSTTGHNHQGAHQGGGFSSLNLTGSLTVGTTLTVTGAASLASLTVSGTTHLIGAVTCDAPVSAVNIQASGYVAAGPVLSGAPGDLTANRGGTGYVLLGDGTHYVSYDGGNYQMPGAWLYVNGQRVVTETAVETLTNKTLNAPTINGTISGSVTWSANQTFSGDVAAFSVHTTQDISAGGAFFLPAAQNAAIRPSNRSGHPSAEVQIDSYLYVVGDVYAGLRMYAISFNQTSDPALKANMTVVSDDDCMLRVRAVVPVQTYQMTMPPSDTPQPTPWEIGFSAPDVYAASPEFVTLDAGNQPVGLNYANMAAMLWGALRQLDARCQAKGI